MTKIIHVSGRRKRSIARATLCSGKGLVRFNKVPIDQIQPIQMKLQIQEPLILAPKTAKRVNVDINVHGGGVVSQVQAARLALARALVQFDKKLEKTFIKYDRHLLVADVRRKEQCKPNDSKARAKRQKSYR